MIHRGEQIQNLRTFALLLRSVAPYVRAGNLDANTACHGLRAVLHNLAGATELPAAIYESLRAAGRHDLRGEDLAQAFEAEADIADADADGLEGAGS